MKGAGDAYARLWIDDEGGEHRQGFLRVKTLIIAHASKADSPRCGSELRRVRPGERRGLGAPEVPARQQQTILAAPERARRAAVASESNPRPGRRRSQAAGISSLLGARPASGWRAMLRGVRDERHLSSGPADLPRGSRRRSACAPDRCELRRSTRSEVGGDLRRVGRRRPLPPAQRTSARRGHAGVRLGAEARHAARLTAARAP